MNRKTLIAALFLLALGGLMLHYRIHPYMVADKANPGMFLFNPTNFLATLFPLIDLVVVTLLFCSRGTAVYGFLLNGLIVIYGTVLMAHFSIAGLSGKQLSLFDMVLRSTIPDIAIAWADFFVGKALYDLYTRGPVAHQAALVNKE